MPITSPRIPPRPARAESAFTLVEVIVVLVILAMLIAVGVLSLRSNRSNGLRVQAATTATALGEGIDQFVRDHGGRVPDQPGTDDWDGTWYSPVDEGNQRRPYVKRSALVPLQDGVVTLETSTGGTGGPAPVSKSARIRYHANVQNGWYALVVRIDRGQGFAATCVVTNADTTGGSGAAWVSSVTGGTRSGC